MRMISPVQSDYPRRHAAQGCQQSITVGRICGKARF